MKWALIMFGAGLLRGILVPDYATPGSLVIIPFITPIVIAGIAAYAFSTGALGVATSNVMGMASVLLSTVIGASLFFVQDGFTNYSNDQVSQAIFLFTMAIQIGVYIVAGGLFLFLAKRFGKSTQPDPQQPQPHDER